MAKPAGPACNLACDYCFYREKPLPSPRGGAPRMTAEVLETFVSQYIESQPGDVITFAWQGGEPTLLGTGFYQGAIDLQARYAEGRSVRNTFQTNGLLLDERWAAFLAENRFLVGVSIDGPPGLHDRYRHDAAGGPSAERVLRAMETMKRAGVEFNTLTVVNRRNSEHALEVYDFLRETGSGYIQFIPLVEQMVPGGNGGRALAGPALPPGAGAAIPGVEAVVAPWSVEPTGYGDFLCTIFNRWVRQDVGRVFVQQFEAALASWAGRDAGVCVFGRHCGRALVLEHNGDLFSCDHYVYPAWRLGNIMDTPLAVLAASETQAAFGAAKQDLLPRQCRECSVRFACHGECPKHRFLKTPQGEPGLSYLCAAYRGFFTAAGPYLQAMAQLLDSQRSPALIMDMLRADDVRRRLATAGRNDRCPCGSGRKYKHCCGRGGSRGSVS